MTLSKLVEREREWRMDGVSTDSEAQILQEKIERLAKRSLSRSCSGKRKSLAKIQESDAFEEMNLLS